MADTVKLHGATTVVNVVITPHRGGGAEVTGHTLEIVGNATGKGLVDLVDGKADASLASEPLEIAVEAAALAGKKVDVKTLQMHEIRKDEVAFVVHSRTLSAASRGAARRHPHRQGHQLEAGRREGRPIVVYSDAVTAARGRW